jgi:hypothetical protein
MDVTTASLERYQRERLDTGKAPATVNREVHALRRAFNVASRQTPPLFPKHLVPYFPSLPVDNVRSGFFERAEVEALLQHVADDGIRDFIAWASGPACGRVRLPADLGHARPLRRALGPEDPGSDHEEPHRPHTRPRG